MKRVFVTLITAILFCVACKGESPTATITIEILEFDCTEHPDLFQKYENFRKPPAHPEAGALPLTKPDQKQETEILNEIERVAVKTTLLYHSQEIAIGSSINQTTQCQGAEFKLKARTEAADTGNIGLELDLLLASGEHKKMSTGTALTVQRGQIIPLGGGTNTTTTRGENGAEKTIKTVSIWRLKFD
jgi:hypothetical protein